MPSPILDVHPVGWQDWVGDGGTLPLAQIAGQMRKEPCLDSLLTMAMDLAVNLSKEGLSYNKRSISF